MQRVQHRIPHFPSKTKSSPGTSHLRKGRHCSPTRLSQKPGWACEDGELGKGLASRHTPQETGQNTLNNYFQTLNNTRRRAVTVEAGETKEPSPSRPGTCGQAAPGPGLGAAAPTGPRRRKGCGSASSQERGASGQLQVQPTRRAHCVPAPRVWRPTR